MLKICFIGLGSIGKKHIKNITSILKRRGTKFVIDAIRSTDRSLPEDINIFIRRVYRSLEELTDVYDIIFVTNPTICHYDTIKRAMPYAKNMFIEKPIFHQYVQNLNEFRFNSEGIYYVACPLRYGSVVSELKKRITNEQIYSVRAISSSYLPDWRKGIDYRQIYSAHKDMGGGVTLDLIHELDYIIWLFGIPEMSCHLCGKYSDLEIDSDDLSVYLLKYEDKIAEIHVDYLGRECVRNIELFCKDYVIKGDLLHNTLKYIYSGGVVEEIILPEANMYLQEMEAFLDVIEQRRKNENDIMHANQILRIALENCYL